MEFTAEEHAKFEERCRLIKVSLDLHRVALGLPLEIDDKEPCKYATKDTTGDVLEEMVQDLKARGKWSDDVPHVEEHEPQVDYEKMSETIEFIICVYDPWCNQVMQGSGTKADKARNVAYYRRIYKGRKVRCFDTWEAYLAEFEADCERRDEAKRRQRRG